MIIFQSMRKHMRCNNRETPCADDEIWRDVQICLIAAPVEALYIAPTTKRIIDLLFINGFRSLWGTLYIVPMMKRRINRWFSLYGSRQTYERVNVFIAAKFCGATARRWNENSSEYSMWIGPDARIFLVWMKLLHEKYDIKMS